MNHSFNILLWPISLIYGSIAGLRRLYFELFNKRTSVEIPTIIVGNLTVGGTGKTPMVLYLADLLMEDYHLAVLSRGYGRRSKGFLEVEKDSQSEEVGDEPKEIKLQQLQIPVYVAENRLEGLSNIISLHPEVNLVLLDDGFQHLPLRGKVNILLCNFHRPFYKDFVMPAGRLREFKLVAKGVDMIIVTKCPTDLSIDDACEMELILKRYCRQIFFTSYNVTTPNLLIGKGEIHLGEAVILITGVAEGKKVRDELKDVDVVKHFNYLDHTNFGMKELQEWIQYAKDFEVSNMMMTRKDWMRVKDLVDDETIFGEMNVYEIHTEISFLFGGIKTFKKTLTDLI